MNKINGIIFEEKNKIGIITLSKERVLNAWNKEMRTTICQIFKKIKKQKKIKAVIITGAGEKAFCAGQDLNELKDFKSSQIESWIDEFKNVYSAIRSSEIPTIACINGAAVGSGFQLALLTDIRVSHKDVKLGQVEINSGIVSVTGPWIIQKVLGLSTSIELSLTGKLINGQEAFKRGIIHHLTKKNNTMQLSLKIAKELSEKPVNAMVLTKKRFWETFKVGMNEAFESAKRYHKISFKSGEPQKKTKKFLNK
jgi:enoyl-CoA hydratase/carnithine racemase|tara:strand:+ start:3939 stop:4697 length:759 start_codon:yes stop_codon:yes gene_type:complete